MNVKDKFLNKKIIFKGTETVLSSELSKEVMQSMVDGGLSLYFDKPKVTKLKATKPTNIVNPNKKDASNKEK